MRPRWPIGFRRNYHLLSYFLPGLFMSISHPIPRCRKNLSSFFSPREISPGLARSSRLWRVPNRRILHSSLIPRASIFASIFCAPPLSLFLFLVSSLVPSYSGPFHFIFRSLASCYFLHFSSSLFHFPVKNSSSSSSASAYSPVSSHTFFFLVTEARRNLATLILQPLNAASRGLKRWRCVTTPNLLLPLSSLAKMFGDLNCRHEKPF